MKRLVTIILCGLTVFFDNAVAQQDPQYNQYMFNQLTVNPGYAGSRDAICATLLHRQQWVGISGAPVTSVFTVHTPFRLFGHEHGVGLTIVNDVLGFNKDLSISVSYAYRMNVGPGKLGIGVSGTFLNKALSASWHIPAGGAPEQDEAIPAPNQSVMGFDMGLGAFYRSERAYLGLSTTHLLQPKVKYMNAQEEKTSKSALVLKRHYYAIGGCLIPLKNPAWELDPSLMAYSDGTASQVTANVNVMYNKKIWGGLGYRLNDAIIAMVGVDLFSGLKVGYSYDYSLSDVRRYSGGSHEITVNYCFNLFKEKIIKKYKSVRFL
ncbi:MAG: type IX secretion system membrane protein PorP/SprF [Bacteroidales bacterium]|jgi:type IX secretion system PorP/SprF family membrane protein|nr:type IX secretion system membrane protein PorP/SprF [Bacteroidales bacterium]